ncbi:hypothetical protein K1719_045728 [Acacia pycnantha]|nr:hypothetical protein K1719_045728 [Acacia pycnantha]
MRRVSPSDIILRSDSTEAVHFIKFEAHEMHIDISVIMEIKGMLEWNWCEDVLVVHRDRQTAMVTDVGYSSVVSEKKS